MTCQAATSLDGRVRVERCLARHLIAILVQAWSLGPLEAQADLPLFHVHAEDFDFQFVTGLDHVLGIVDLLLRQFADMQKAFEALFQFDEHAEIGNLGHLAANDLPGQVVRGDHSQPRVFAELLETQRHSHFLFVDGQDDTLKLLAFLEHLRRMADAARPRQVRHVQHAVDARLDLHECSEAGHVLHAPVDDGSRWVLLLDDHPGILGGLFHAERNLLLVLVDVEDDHVDLLPFGNQLAGV